MGSRPYSSVVWSEGMHLAQHHFQAQSRYLEGSLAFAATQLSFKPYGFLRLSMDEEAIQEGLVAILEAKGLMPDGLPFDFPQGDSPPAPARAREEGGTGGGGTTVFLAIPAFVGSRANCDDPDEGGNQGQSENRYRPLMVEIRDQNTGLDKKGILLASKNFRLAYASEIPEGMVALPLAQIRPGPAGHFEYVKDFIPPCLDLAATPRLPGILSSLVGMLRSKSEVMAQRRAMVGDSLADLSSEEVLSYWMSHSLHSGLTGLRHLMNLSRCHPESLFREMAKLAGSLSTFSTEFEAGDLPAYDHENLTECFKLLEGRIRRLLQVMVPEGFLAVRLARTGPNVLSATLEDARVFRKSEWVLQVTTEQGAADVLRNVPTLVKVCSAEHILRLVDDANPGLPLEHVANPPSSIPRRLGSQYFRLVQTGPCWQLIEAQSSIGIYVPDVLSGVRMELVVVQA